MIPLPSHLPTFHLGWLVTPFLWLVFAPAFPWTSLPVLLRSQGSTCPRCSDIGRRHISIKEAGVGPAVTLFAEGLASVFWKASVVGHMSEVSCEEKPSPFSSGITGTGCLWGRLTGDSALKPFGVFQWILVSWHPAFALQEVEQVFKLSLFCEVAGKQQRVEASGCPKASSCQPRSTEGTRLMLSVIDGDGCTPPPKTLPGRGPSLRVSQLSWNGCAGCT